MRKSIFLISIILLASCGGRQEGGELEQMRGVVLTTGDLSSVAEWPRMAAESGINTIGTHITPSEVLAFLATGEGKRFMEDCRRYGICVEHQLHAMSELLPRSLFEDNPQMFRMDSLGMRTPDANCCAHSEEALRIIASNATELARQLRSDNHRYYFWLDDNAPVCCCPLCKDFSPSEQALIIENHMLEAIRTVDPKAKLAHLAYSHFMDPPQKVKPAEGIFLEFAPIYRSWDVPLAEEDSLCPRGYPVSNGDNLRWLEANLEVFDAEDAVVLEYWLDVSLFSRWKRPGVQLPWHPGVCASDLATYASYGIKHITSFAAWMDSSYFARFPSWKPVQDYGKLLRTFGHADRLTDWWGQEDGRERKDCTKVSWCADSDSLRIFFDVHDTTLTISKAPDERSVDDSDRIEVFLSCDTAMSCYYGFEIDPRGKVMDYKNSFYRNFGFEWNGEIATSGRIRTEGYSVCAAFSLDYLRTLGILHQARGRRNGRSDETLLLGLFRADAVPAETATPERIVWYSLCNPRTPEPDFHVPAALFQILL